MALELIPALERMEKCITTCENNTHLTMMRGWIDSTLTINNFPHIYPEALDELKIKLFDKIKKHPKYEGDSII